ncbi:hypothetical protein [Phyllobacterium sophorae]|uniref:hypothetical protein n=1 Tax=Phyllobacterium sophorae TaxID=1520277 RepID=UPI0011B24D59|nr:hypothetical protein [Phyllobacterium sophorae]
MSDTIRAITRSVFPNFPDELAEEWLAPFVTELGEPNSDGRWLNILGGRPLDFWRGVAWYKECVDLITLVGSALTQESNRTLAEMEMGYFNGVSNPYSQYMPNGRETTLQALEYLRTHQVFHSPPVLLCHPSGTIDIMDGNHRMLAYVLAVRENPPSANSAQFVWIGRYDS